MRMSMSRGGPVFTAIVAVLCVPVICSLLSLSARAQQEVTLSFNIPAGKTFYYKASSQLSRNLSGVDVNAIVSIEANMILIERDEEGVSKVEFEFLKSKSTLYYGGEISDRESPLQLEGKKAVVTVDSRGDVREVSRVAGAGREVEMLLNACFVMLPEKPVKLGDEWTEEMLETDPQAEEGSQPRLKGVHKYKFKKIEEKRGYQVAVIEVKSELLSHSVTPAGTSDTKTKGEIDLKIALDGGFVVELDRSMETEGKTVSTDEFTGKKTEEDIFVSTSFECKLEGAKD